MPLPISSAICPSKVRLPLRSFIAVGGFICAHATAFTALPPLMPLPAEIHEDAGGTYLPIERHLKVDLKAKTDPRVSDAILRLTDAWSVRVGEKISPAFVSPASATCPSSGRE